MIRMGLTVVCVLVVVGVLIAVVGGIPGTSDNTNSLAKIRTIGLPEHGIAVVAPTDARFGTLVSGEFQTTDVSDAATLKTSSVIVVNESGQCIAGLRLNWELLQPDGRTMVHYRGFSSNLLVVSDGGSPSLAEALPQNGHRLVSLLHIYNSPNRRFRTSIGGGRTNELRLLAESVQVTISVDGVLFADGTFVGPDTTGFFDMLKAEVEARTELFEEAARALKGDSESMTRIEMLAKGNREAQQLDDSALRLASDRDRSWAQLFKRRYAAVIVAGRKLFDDKTHLERINAELDKPRITLRKL